MNARSIRTLLVVVFLVTGGSTTAEAVILPSALSGLKAWYKPSTLGAGPSITSWADSSGNGNHISKAIAPFPTLVTGLGTYGLPGVHFDVSVNDGLTRALFNNSATSTIFVMARVTSTNATYGIWLDGQLGRQTMYHYNNEFSMFAGTEQRDVLAGAGGTNDFKLHNYMGLFDGASSIGSVDGLESVGVINPGTDAIGTLIVGDHTALGNGNDATLDIAEVIIYNRALSLSERLQIYEYLNDQYLHVPEPSTLTLAGLGLVGAFVKRRRRRNAS